VLVDGTVVGVFTPGSLDYATYTTPAFNVAAGSHTIEFLGLDTVTGDNSAFVDDIRLVAATLAPGDAGFETPSVATAPYGFQAAPTGTPWSFSGTLSGFASNGSAFNNLTAPEGSQVAFLQKTGAMSQTVNGWVAGSYVLSFYAAQRDESGTVQAQNFEVLIDGAVVGTITPTSASYAVYTTPAFAVTAGSHTIEFLGLDSAGGDNTAFIDAVKLTQVTSDHLYYSAQDQVIEERVGGTAASNVLYQYVCGAGYVDQLVLRDTYSGGVEQASARLYAQWNANYDVTALVNTSGAVVERYLYDPYGSATVTNASWTPVTGNTSAYGWLYLHQGGRLDTVTGWYEFRNRDLIPSQGTWAERDPLGFGGGSLDLYGYEGNSPANMVDPLGLSGLDPLLEGVMNSRGRWGANIGQPMNVGGNTGVPTVNAVLPGTINPSTVPSYIRTELEGTHKPSLDDLQQALDIAGTVDPTGAADAAGVGLSLYRGDLAGAAISLLGMFGLDLFKKFRSYRKAGKLADEAVDTGKNLFKNADECAQGPVSQFAKESPAPNRRVYTGTDGPVDLNRPGTGATGPGGLPTSRGAGGTHVTTKDLTDPEVLTPFAADYIPGSRPKRVSEIEVPANGILRDPTGDVRPDTGWIAPNTPGASVVKEWDVDWGDFMSPPTISPRKPGT
jgi:RHS repeat-associated protein